MKIYNYDKTTKEYLFESEASLDPQATKNQGKEVYLIPDCATDKKPPSIHEHEVLIFDNVWKIVSDYRGLYIVNSDMIPEIVEEIGNIKEGYIVITDEQAHKIQEDDLFYVISNNTLIENPNYEQDKQAREQERINGLNLTKADFWIALLDRNITKDMVKEKINLIPDEKLKAKTLIRLDDADHFWRGDPSMNVIGKMFNITPQELNYLFEHKELPSEVENV